MYHLRGGNRRPLPHLGPKELALIEASGWRRFPPRLPHQPIFSPVLDEGYAAEIARDSKVPNDYLVGPIVVVAEFGGVP